MLACPGRCATVRRHTAQRTSGSWVTVTGWRQGVELLIGFHSASRKPLLPADQPGVIVADSPPGWPNGLLGLRPHFDAKPDHAERTLHEAAVETQRPQRSTRFQGQSVAIQRATASASGTSRSALSARTQDCTVTSHSSDAEGYR
jgi:hypothetical protein